MVVERQWMALGQVLWLWCHVWERAEHLEHLQWGHGGGAMKMMMFVASEQWEVEGKVKVMG